MKKDNEARAASFLIFLVVVLLLWYISLLFTAKEVEVPFSTFLKEVNLGEVSEAVVVLERNQIHYTVGKKRYFCYFVSGEDFMPILLKRGVKVVVKPPSWWNQVFQLVLGFSIPFFLAIMFFSYLMGRGATSEGEQISRFTRSKAVKVERGIKTRFSDVAGLDEAKEELWEIVDFLKNKDKYVEMGAKIPKGVLLVGPPGCGKTLMARAIAGEANVAFFHTVGSEFVEVYVGVGAARVRDLFTRAKRESPCIVFIDEIDAVGRHRGAGLGGGHDEREQTLNQLLVEMDGFDENSGIIVLAATNRPDILDPALLRPGRFDRRVIIDRPTLKGREEILKIHTRNKKLAEDVDLHEVARLTPGFTGADLENVANEAAILAVRKGKDRITMAEFEEAVEKVLAGPTRRSLKLTEEEKRRVAFHEGGHALVAALLPNADPVRKITVLPRGLALGYTFQLPDEEKYLRTKSELMDEIKVLMGGRTAEKHFFGDVSTGAENDLKRATEIARSMVKVYGMSERLGAVYYGSKEGSVFLGKDLVSMRDYSDEVAYRIDQEVKRLLEESSMEAHRIISEHAEVLEKLADVLMEKETVDGEEFLRFLQEEGVRLPPNKASRLKRRETL